jgi:hypothetical protein
VDEEWGNNCGRNEFVIFDPIGERERRGQLLRRCIRNLRRRNEQRNELRDVGPEHECLHSTAGESYKMPQ